MLQQLGWDEDWATAFASLPGNKRLTPGRVTAVHRGRVETDTTTSLPLAGSLAHAPVVGDWIAHDGNAVRAILPRRTALERDDGALVANVDTAIVVTSLNKDLKIRRIERFTAMVRAGGIVPVVALSKGDLHDDPFEAAQAIGAELAAEAIPFSAHDGWGVEELRARMTPRSTTVLIGMSGVGKSTLVNLLLGTDTQRVLEVRADDDRGRHATTHRELFVLADGALLIDTPGVRKPGLATDEGVEETFADIAELAQGCRFADCRHETEPGCAVRGVVSPERLASLHKLEREGATAQERKERGRQGSKMVREATRTNGR